MQKKLNELLTDIISLEELLCNSDNSVNVFDVLKITNTEIRHSNVLAWILNPNENHGFGDVFIKHLTSYISKKCHSKKQIDTLLNCNHNSFSVRREWRNIDLLVISSESKVVIAIENKIKSGEHGDQLARYREIIESQYPHYERFYLFLTLGGYDSTESDIWYSIGYIDIVEWLAAFLESSKSTAESYNILKQYHAILRREVMRYSDEVIELCNQICDKHKDALDLIYKVRKENDNEYFSEIINWVDEWKSNGLITDYTLDVSKTICIRTPFLDKFFPIDKSRKWKTWINYYAIAPFPFANKIFFEFKFDKNTTTDDAITKFDAIKPIFNYEKSYNEGTYGKYHRLKTWKMSEYNPDERDDFIEVSDNLKAEIERMLKNEISVHENKIEIPLLK